MTLFYIMSYNLLSSVKPRSLPTVQEAIKLLSLAHLLCPSFSREGCLQCSTQWSCTHSTPMPLKGLGMARDVPSTSTGSRRPPVSVCFSWFQFRIPKGIQISLNILYYLPSRGSVFTTDLYVGCIRTSIMVISNRLQNSAWKGTPNVFKYLKQNEVTCSEKPVRALIPWV